MKDSDRIVALWEKMKKNSEEMRTWKNQALAEEAFTLLRNLDDPEEGPLGKALACDAIVGQLSEYDIPRFCLKILRWEIEQLEATDEKSERLGPEEVREHILKLEEWINPGKVSDADFMKKWGRHLAWDPVERSARWEELYPEVEKECDRLLGDAPRGMGFCFGYWAAKRGALAKKGIDWKDPHAMNPRVMFD